MKKGFTLSEVLITLGIIGVIAAMTLPSLINQIRDKQFRTAFKKQYSVFSQAMQKAYMEEGIEYSIVNWPQMPRYFCRIQNEMKVLHSGIICPKNVDTMEFESNQDWPKSGKEYWHAPGKWFDRAGNPQSANGGYTSMSFLLPDGGLVLYCCVNQIFIDVNGYQKPNTIGKDIFYFILSDGAVLPGFFSKSGTVSVNICARGGSNSTPTLTKQNYKQDCESGSGWGCSPLYILE